MGLLREYVFARDGICVAAAAAREGVRPHECRDRWSSAHEPEDLDRMTLAHVPAAGENAVGKRADDDERHTVTECYAANVLTGKDQGPSADLRAFERRWLALREPGTIDST